MSDRTALNALVAGFTDGGLNPASEFRTYGTDMVSSNFNLDDDLVVTDFTPTLVDVATQYTYTIGSVDYARLTEFLGMAFLEISISNINTAGAGPGGVVRLGNFPTNIVSVGGYEPVFTMGRFSNQTQTFTNMACITQQNTNFVTFRYANGAGMALNTNTLTGIVFVVDEITISGFYRTI